LLPEGGPHVMISPNMVVDGLTWREVTGPGNLTLSACTDPDPVVPSTALTGPDLLLTKN
jgi:hypothetical protein